MVVNYSSSDVSYHCSNTAGSFISVSFVIVHIVFVLPASLLIFYVVHRRWRRQRSTSHSDVFTFHSTAVELIFDLGFALHVCGQYFGLSGMSIAGFYATTNLFSGQISFHVLTCVERYLAIVHPVIYLRLRHSGGVRIRNVSIGFAWLLYCGWMGVTALYYPDVPDVPFFCLFYFSIVIVSFCSVSVLRVLIRPGPGDVGGNRERVDQSRQRALHTVTAITGVLWLYFIGMLITLALERSGLLSYTEGCLVLACGYLFSLPSSSVLPLLYLHRARKTFLGCPCSSE